jgi:hypothetical protein
VLRFARNFFGSFAAVWLNRYTKYWQEQFDVLAATLTQIDERRAAEPARTKKSRRNPRHK